MRVSGGDQLEAALKRISANVKKASIVDVGFIGNATEADGTSVAMVAAINEFGAPSRGQPPRPFFRQAITKNSPKWPANVAAALKANGYDAAKALDLIGQEVQEEIQESIRDLNSPPLAPATVKAKGFDKPLIDTSTMINSVTHKVT